jgi:hypothetical protein
MVMTDIATIKAFVWKNGIESCCVGFVSSLFQKIYENSLEGRVLNFAEYLIIQIRSQKDIGAQKIME